jgi:hypothetical protein
LSLVYCLIYSNHVFPAKPSQDLEMDR